MTPDDLPTDDQIARAARDGLRRLAGSHAPMRLDWDGVVSGARRVRQLRMAAVAAACAIVLATAGAAFAGTTRDRAMTIAGQGEDPATTTTTAPESTTTSSTSTTTTTFATLGPGGVATDSSTPAAPAVTARPEDVTGTMTVPDAPLVVGQPAAISVTLRNISNHTISLVLGRDAWIGLSTEQSIYDYPGLHEGSPTPPPLLPGEQRTLTGTFKPAGYHLGTTVLRVAFVAAQRPVAPGPTFLDGVDPVTVFVIAPGWTPGQPLDPGMGKWNVVMSADAPSVVAGESVTLHATIANVGDQPQATAAYGVLGFVCDGWDGPGFGDNASPVGPATLAPGETRVFDFEYRPPSYYSVRQQIPCWIGITFAGDRIRSQPHDGLTTDTVMIDVLTAETTTTSSTTTTVSSP